MIARHIRPTEIDSVNENLTYPSTSKEWFREAWMHHNELGLELSNLYKLMKILNDSNKKTVEPEILRTINDVNIHIRLLKKKYYKILEMEELETNPMKSLVENYINYNAEMLKRVQHLMSTVKFSYN